MDINDYIRRLNRKKYMIEHTKQKIGEKEINPFHLEERLNIQDGDIEYQLPEEKLTIKKRSLIQNLFGRKNERTKENS